MIMRRRSRQNGGRQRTNVASTTRAAAKTMKTRARRRNPARRQRLVGDEALYVACPVPVYCYGLSYATSISLFSFALLRPQPRVLDPRLLCAGFTRPCSNNARMRASRWMFVLLVVYVLHTCTAFTSFTLFRNTNPCLPFPALWRSQTCPIASLHSMSNVRYHMVPITSLGKSRSRFNADLLSAPGHSSKSMQVLSIPWGWADH